MKLPSTRRGILLWIGAVLIGNPSRLMRLIGKLSRGNIIECNTKAVDIGCSLKLEKENEFGALICGGSCECVKVG